MDCRHRRRSHSCYNHFLVDRSGGFILIGFLAAAEASGGHKCAHCGSYDTDVTKKEDGFEYWQCNKCHGITYDYITK